MPVTAVEEGPVAVLRMEMPRANAIGLAFLDAMGAALDGVARPRPRPLVLTGAGRTFSSGLDLVEASGHGREAMARFVDGFDDLFLRVFSWPAPVAAALNGHAFAGGGILALACDRRVAAPGDHVLSLNEVLLGVPFPPAALAIARHATPSPARGALLLEGRRFGPEEALRAGLVHEVSGAEGPLPRALEWARASADVPADAWARVKADLQAPALRAIEADRAEGRRRWLDAWFSEEARARIAARLAGLRGRPRGIR